MGFYVPKYLIEALCIDRGITLCVDSIVVDASGHTIECLGPESIIDLDIDEMIDLAMDVEHVIFH